MRHATDAARHTAIAWSDRSEAAELIARNPTLWSASESFRPAIRDGLSAWMRAIAEDVRSQAGRKRAVAQVAALGVNAVAVAVMLAVFINTAGLTGAEVGIAAGTAVLNQKLLEAIFGEGAMRCIFRGFGRKSFRLRTASTDPARAAGSAGSVTLAKCISFS